MGDDGDLETIAKVWNVQSGSLVQVEGVALRYSSRFAAKLTTSNGAFRDILTHDDVGATVLIDPRTGEVDDAEPNGCA